MSEDEIERRPASENPWYVLMTIAGEQFGGFDEELHARNRRFWHGWIGSQLDDGAKEKLCEEYRCDPAEFAQFEAAETTEWEAAIKERPSVFSPKVGDAVDFQNTDFHTNFWCSGFYFPDDVRFESAVFSGYAHFKNVTFKQGAYFAKSEFFGMANFSKAIFSFDSSFLKANFSDDALFRSTNFLRDCNFTSAKLCRSVDFSAAEFCGLAYFIRATFRAGCNFLNAEFSTDADFRNAAFCGGANFASAAFSGYGYFMSAKFLGEADFEKSSFASRTYFDAACFVGKIDFSNCVMKARTSFENTVFQNEPPRFFEADMHEDTDWSGIIWPVPNKSKEKPSELRRAYERLKLLMDGQKKTHDEQMFHRMELQCREVEDGFPKNVPSRLYGVVSEYGWSFVRPGIALALVVMLGWMVLGPVLCWGGGSAAEVSACSFRGLYVSVSNTFGFLGLWRLIPDAVDLAMQQSVLAMIVKVVQAVFGPVFLFFVLLALRNRYRMR